MKKTLVAVAILAMAAYGCAGRTPNPVAGYELGDDRKSCNSLKAELANTHADIQRKLPDVNKTGQNVALGVTGAFLLVPLFFMDFSKADQIEVEALRRRYNNLVILASEKSCGFEDKPIPDFQKPPAATAS
jgi:hypothetical protein